MSEYYAWDYRVLKTFAKHYLTNEVISEKLVESMKCAKKMFAATDLQRQRGNYSKDEEELIMRMHQMVGNRWSAIAACLPGRRDNEKKTTGGLVLNFESFEPQV